MPKPHNQKLHDCWAEDFIFFKQQKDFFIQTATKHPGDTRWHEIIVGLKKLIKVEQSRYKEIYGEVFKMRNVDAKTLIEWIEKSSYVPNDWEQGFIDDMLSLPWNLNKNQTTCLEKIYAKSAGGGVYQKKEGIRKY